MIFFDFLGQVRHKGGGNNTRVEGREGRREGVGEWESKGGARWADLARTQINISKVYIGGDHGHRRLETAGGGAFDRQVERAAGGSLDDKLPLPTLGGGGVDPSHSPVAWAGGGGGQRRREGQREDGIWGGTVSPHTSCLSPLVDGLKHHIVGEERGWAKRGMTRQALAKNGQCHGCGNRRKTWSHRLIWWVLCCWRVELCKQTVLPNKGTGVQQV